MRTFWTAYDLGGHSRGPIIAIDITAPTARPNPNTAFWSWWSWHFEDQSLIDSREREDRECKSLEMQMRRRLINLRLRNVVTRLSEVDNELVIYYRSLCNLCVALI